MKGDKYKNLRVYRDKGLIDDWYIKEFEKNHNCCLPKNYKHLVSKHNCVRFYQDYFDFVNFKGEKGIRNFIFKGFGEKEDISEHIEDVQLHVSHPDYYGLPGIVAFASTGEGDMVCFDYRDNLKSCEPRIILMIHDEYITHEDESVTMVIEFIANSFDEFLNILYEDD